ncbi:Ribosomal oxygenase 1 [Seminavis robusta]|uniref:Bifunctional lysine-specific demethylase and histidyl-hydroxylase n=1 Tax=Seminavis robusta TaxID=568900 RepID=A0A9N8D8U7_9STRA|nr:Ribosomal oxygenase 1 [Seminavis robusta]|eukprot:Sro34_g021820.1 Ribosomal oxygenase 1 (513) ;mRNA; f:14391-15929
MLISLFLLLVHAVALANGFSSLVNSPVDGAINTVSGTQKSPSSDQDNETEESKALLSILGGETGLSDFFDSVWQHQPALIRTSISTSATSATLNNVHFDEEKMKLSPFEELIGQGWTILTDLMEQPFRPNENEPPLVIHNGLVQHPQEWMPAYSSTSLYAPYLNGSTVMQAHADCLSPWLAAFCQDLQKTFPYVYTNTYITPPHSRALNCHADDRDVLVVQLAGSKHWQVKKEVPIPFPYPHEQVGKADLEVPDYVEQGEDALTCTLQPGDVLYIPRGHCHQAQCTDELSFHVTIAVATFDWTLAGMIHQASKNILTNALQHRKSILPLQGLQHVPGNDDKTTTTKKQALQTQIDQALDLLHQQITPDAVLNNLQARIDPHRERAHVGREAQIQRGLVRLNSHRHNNNNNNNDNTKPSPAVIGMLASKQINFDTKLRAATDEERQQLPRVSKLQVREEMAQDVQSILAELKANPASLSDILSLRTSPAWCQLAWLGFAKQAVEVGELALAEE